MLNTLDFRKELINSFFSLKSYCKNENFKGYDPYDGLNSPFLIFLKKSKKSFLKICWIQFFKRFPFNLRKIFFIKKSFNPKSYALFLSGYCNLYKNDPQDIYLQEIHFFIENKFIMKRIEILKKITGKEEIIRELF